MSQYSLQTKPNAFSISSDQSSSGNAFSVATPMSAPPPRIGPEIGPDPRNAEASINFPPTPNFQAENGVRFDFVSGFRVAAPAGDGKYLLRVFDLDTQTNLVNFEMKGGQIVVGERKYYIRYRFELIDSSTGKIIASHDYNCENQKVMIVIPDGGLGDNLAWLPYAEAFRVEHHAKVTLACGEWLIRLVKDQYPELDFLPVSQKPTTVGYYAAYFCAIFPKARFSWRPTPHQHLGMQGTIAAILGVQNVPRKVRLKLNAPRTVQEPYVVISAMSTNPDKHWNFPDGWNRVCRYLKRLGFRVFVIDREHDQYFAGVKYTVPSEAEDDTGVKPLTERIALLQHADFFIGLPSGLSWLAWSCNIPIVMLAGFTLDGSEFPTPYRIFNHNFCHGCWNNSNSEFDMHVPVWCPMQLGTPHEIECTKTITPEMVIAQLNRIPSVRHRIAPPLSVLLKLDDVPAAYFQASMEALANAVETYANAEILVIPGAIPSSSDVPCLLRDWQRRKPGLFTMASAPLKPSGKYLFYLKAGDILLKSFALAPVIAELEAKTVPASFVATAYCYNPDGLVGRNAQYQTGILVKTDAVRAADGSCPETPPVPVTPGVSSDEIQVISFTHLPSPAQIAPGTIPGTVLETWEQFKPVPTATIDVLAEKKISVVLPAFRGTYLRPCVESIVKAFAPYGKTEILIRNDASPEGGLSSLLDNLASENRDMVQVFHGQENLGPAAARNFLLEHSHGDYIVCFDHDDIMLPFNVAQVVDFMDTHPEYAASYAPKYLFNQEKGYLEDIRGSEFSGLLAFIGPKVSLNAIFLRRNPLLECGGFLEMNGDKTSCLDGAYLCTRMLQKYDFHFDSNPRTLYRIHPQQMTTGKNDWDNWITQKVCETYPEIYERICKGDIPDLNGADFRIVRGLIGAAIYFNQNTPNILSPLLNKALQAFPEDPGLPNIYMLLLRKYQQYETARQYAVKTFPLFNGNLRTQLDICIQLINAYQDSHVEVPQEIMKAYQLTRQRYLAPPQIVEQGLKDYVLRQR